MALSPEDKAEILELLKESTTAIKEDFKTQLEETQKTLSTEFQNQGGGIMGRTKKEIEKAISGVKNDISTELSNTLKELFPQGQNNQEPDNNNNEENNNNQPPVNNQGQNNQDQGNQQLTQLAQQIKNQADQMKELQERYKQAEEARLQSEQAAARSRLETEFISQVGEKVVDPKTFLKVLMDSGKIVEKDGKLLAQTGKHTLEGTAELVPADTYIDNFLNTDYKYFAKIRPGNGGSSDNGANGDRAPNYQSKYFGENNNTTADDIFQAIKSGNEKEVMADLNRVINQ